MFLKLKEFGGISFRPEESVSLSIVHVGPYLVALVCIPPFIDYLFRVYLIFWFLYFDLFPSQGCLQVLSAKVMIYRIDKITKHVGVILILILYYFCIHLLVY